MTQRTRGASSAVLFSLYQATMLDSFSAMNAAEKQIVANTAFSVEIFIENFPMLLGAFVDLLSLITSIPCILQHAISL